MALTKKIENKGLFGDIAGYDNRSSEFICFVHHHLCHKLVSVEMDTKKGRKMWIMRMQSFGSRSLEGQTS